MSPPSCPVCSEIIRYDDVRCHRCNTPHHTRCAAGFLGDSAAASWICSLCLSEGGGRLADDVTGSAQTSPQLLNTDHFVILMKELTAMRTSIDNTNRLVELHSRELADVKTKIGDLETENRLLGERLRILEERPQPCSPANLSFAEVKDRTGSLI